MKNIGETFLRNFYGAFFVTMIAVVFFFASSAAITLASQEAGQHPGLWQNIKKTVKPEKPNIPEEYKDLEKLYTLYWQLFREKDYERAYAMESSNFRKKNPYKDEIYMNLFPRNVKLTSVIALEINEDNLKSEEVLVKGKYYYRFGGFKSFKRFKDRWVKEGSEWKHMPADGPFSKIENE